MNETHWIIEAEYRKGYEHSIRHPGKIFDDKYDAIRRAHYHKKDWRVIDAWVVEIEIKRKKIKLED